MPRWLIVASVLVMVVLVGWYLFHPKQDETDFSLVDIDGEPFQLSDFRGKVVLVDFMATWCVPCQASMSGLLALHEDMGDDVVIISISVDPVSDTEARLRNWKDTWGAQWIHARDLADPPVSQLFEVSGIPTYIIVDKSGGVGHRHVGLTSETTLMKEILELLNR